MDKYIHHHDDFKDIFGHPISVVDPDPKTQRDVRNVALAEGKALGMRHADITWDAAMIYEPTFAQAMGIFANGIPYGDEPKDGEPPLRATPQDLEKAARVVRAFTAHSDGYVKMEEEALNWFKELVAEHASRTYRGTIPTLILERLGAELSAKEIVEVEAAATPVTG